MAKKRRRSSQRRAGGRPVIAVALLMDELDLDAMRAYGSFEFSDYDAYLATCERAMRAMRKAGRIVAETFDPVEYREFCREMELDVDDPGSRARYAALLCEEGDPLPYRGEPIEEFVAALAHRERLRRMFSRAEELLVDVRVGRVNEAEDYAADLFLWLLSWGGVGLRVITCHMGDGESDPLEIVAEVEVRPDKTVLYGDASLVLCQMLTLARATGTCGSLIMRSFTRRIDLSTGWPIKTVCGWSIGNGEISPLSNAEIRAASCLDHRTGDPLPPEPAVEYVDAPHYRPLPPRPRS
jgi:hypothetical protein